jgi:hypothetical protein
MQKMAKIKEAEYFLARMKEEQENREHFVFNLSAFLSAARSVLQYALNEADPKENQNAKPGAKRWYDKSISSSSVLKFFKCRRDINIHIEPISPRKDVGVEAKEGLRFSESLSVRIISPDGKEEAKLILVETEQKQEKPKTSPVPTIKSIYRFNEWPGKEDILALCEGYIQELKKVIQDRVSKGFITEQGHDTAKSGKVC